MTLQGKEYFAAFADDGDDGWDWVSASEYIAIFEDEDSAREAANTFITDWENRWSL